MELVGNVQLARGGAEKLPAVYELLARHGITTHANPDVYVQSFSNYGVEEARALRARASMKALSGGRRVFVVVAATITAEAQNALLKTIEEPAGNTLFIFVVPAPEMLLPTVRSRAQMLELAGDTADDVVDMKTFLSAAPAARIDMLKPLLAKDEDDKRDLGTVIAFLSSLEHALGSKKYSGKKQALEALYRARKYATDKGSLLKPLLEQMALLIPQL